jgi:hypothetical protein
MAKLTKRELLQAIINIVGQYLMNNKTPEQALLEIKLLLDAHGML